MNKYFFRFSSQDKVLFAKRLSILIRSGTPLAEALKILRQQANSKSARRVFDQLVRDVEHGQSLSRSMAKFRGIFTDFGINIVRVGEASGTLHENLNYFAGELEKSRALRRKVIGALVYPIFIVLATLGVTGLIIAYVLPKILPIFRSLKFDLPYSTRVLIAVSGVFGKYGFYLLFGVIILVAALWFLMRTKGFRLLVDRLILKIPILGRLAQSYQMADISRTLGILLGSGVKIVEAIKITSQSATNLAYQKDLELLSGNVMKGEKIAAHMDRNPKLFPPIAAQMVMVGEATGNLSETLSYLAELYESEVDEFTKNLSNVIEPVLMVFMGLIVGFIAISIITPIYGITQNLNVK